MCFFPSPPVFSLCILPLPLVYLLLSVSDVLSLCLFIRLSICLCLTGCLVGVRVPAQGVGGGWGGGELGVGHRRTLVLTLITAGFLRGQDRVMVSLLPPQSDATLPGPARLEGEPQGDLMQAPGLPGSPAPQNVSIWHLAPPPEPSRGLPCPFHQRTSTQ